jgi:zinc protease
MKRYISWLVLLGAFGLCLSALRAADDPKTTAPDSALHLYDDVRTETLSNGLRIFLKPIPQSPVVTTMVVYKVGSSDEDKTFTGLSHYLEHLMFKGTKTLMPGDIDRLTQRNGGQNNAYTTDDYTAFHFDFAADRWEVALDVEADRMRNLVIDTKHEFEQEKGAVIEELAQGEDQPWELESKAILPLLFGKNSPYGHPVIGEREHVQAATAQVIKGHYDKWYHPNNAVLVVVGGFDPDKALAKIKEKFGGIPAGKLPERKPWPPGNQARPARLEIESKFEVVRLLMGFNTVRTGDPDTYALQVIDVLLSGGKTSRLYRKLVEEEQLVNSVSTGSSPGRYAGWFSLQAELLPDKGDPKSRARLEEILLAELKRLVEEPVPAAELERVRRKLLASTIFTRESVHTMADTIATAVTQNDLDWLKQQLPRLLAVSPAEIQRVAQKYFGPEKRVAVWSIPQKKEKKGETGAAAPKSTPRQVARLGLLPRAGSLGDVSLQQTQRHILPNGLTVLLLENRRLPILVAELRLKNPTDLRRREQKPGQGSLMGSLLDEGTATRSSRQIAEQIENLGGMMSFDSNGGTLKVLAQDRRVGLELFFDCLRNPTFPAAAFAREQNRRLGDLLELEQQADYQAAREFAKQVYGKHPNARPSLGTSESIRSLTREDCQRLHAEAFKPSQMLLILVGDFDAKAMLTEIESLTASWRNEETTPLLPLPPDLIPEVKETKRTIISVPDAAQLQFYMGHLGIRRTDPDYFKLLVMDHVLGTGSGFTDRLSARLRDREGLAYTVSANVTSSASAWPGTFTCYIGTKAENLDKVQKLFREEIERLRKEKPTKEEVADVQSYLLGRLAFELVSNEQIADKLLLVERYNLGFDYLEKYRHAIQAVTPADVQQMAEKHLHPDKMIVVAAGAIDKNGKPLPQKGKQ